MLRGDIRCRIVDVVETHRAFGCRFDRSVTDKDDHAQIGKLRPDLGDDRDIITRLVAHLHEQNGDTALPQGIGGFGATVRGIDIDEDRPDLRRRELRDDPLDRIGRPDADAIAVRDTERHESARERIGPLA